MIRRNLLYFFFLLILGCSDSDASFIIRGSAGGAPPDECTGRLVCQNFEGTGYDNSESWTEAGSVTPDEDYTTLALRGSQSCMLTDEGTAASAYVAFTAQSDLWAFFRWRAEGTPLYGQIFNLTNTSGSIQAYVSVSSGPIMRMYHGTTLCSTGSLSASTTYYVWVHYVAGSGSDGVGALYLDTDNSRPAATCSITTGTATADVGRVYMFNNNGTPSTYHYYDQILVDDAEITDVDS